MVKIRVEMEKFNIEIKIWEEIKFGGWLTQTNMLHVRMNLYIKFC